MVSRSDNIAADDSLLRPAREGDLPALTAIYNAAVTGTAFTSHVAPLAVEDRRSWWEAHQDPRYPILVADTGAELLGYASLSLWFDVPLYAHTAESSLYLAPNAQGRGLGTTLMRALLAEACRLGHHIVLARIWSDNAASIAMCRKCGYKIIGTQREVGFRHGVWLDCVQMQVTL